MRQGLSGLETLLGFIETTKPKINPEAQLMELREYAKDYGGGRFTVGDVITPRGMSNYVGRGNPHIVVEVSPQPSRTFDAAESVSDTGSARFGCNLDIRVLSIDGHQIGGFWVESWQFETWTADIAAAVSDQREEHEQRAAAAAEPVWPMATETVGIDGDGKPMRETTYSDGKVVAEDMTMTASAAEAQQPLQPAETAPNNDAAAAEPALA